MKQCGKFVVNLAIAICFFEFSYKRKRPLIQLYGGYFGISCLAK